MKYISPYMSSLGQMLLAADETGLTGVWFEDQKYFGRGLEKKTQETETAVLAQTKQWLDVYFSGREPEFFPTLHLVGTPFQQAVWKILLTIPYGKTMTYGDIAKQLAAERGLAHMSAQAVGGAVGHNPVSILVPCHRCVGSRGQLTGYAGGLERKTYLLRLEQEKGKTTLP